MYLDNGSSVRIPANMSREDFYHRRDIDFPLDLDKELMMVSREITRPVSVIVRSAVRYWLNGYWEEKASTEG